MTLDEIITRAKEKAKEKYIEGFLCHANPDDKELNEFLESGGQYELLAAWLEELQAYHRAGTIKTCKNAIRIVKEISRQKDQRWIPASERLPGDFENVLVWYEYYRYGDFNRLYQTAGISYAFNGKWSESVDGSTGWKDLRIIAWMPLPMPYKEKQICSEKMDEDI